MNRLFRLTPVVGGLALLGACEVVNPGQILDTDLNSPAGFRQLVTGMHGDLQVAMDVMWLAHPLFGDLAGAGFHDQLQMYWRGDTDKVFARDFNMAHAARWVADDGIRRMKEVLGADFDRSPLAAEAHVWSGFSHRLLGDTFCQAVIDGGPVQDRKVYYERAEERFTEALRLARQNNQTNFATAALAGRAQVRAQQQKWAGALEDARQVPDNYVFNVQFSTASTRSRNTLFHEHFNRQNSSVKFTFFEEYFNQTQDRRVDNRNPLPGQAQLGGDGRTPHRRQWKFPTWDSHIALAKGPEMRLLEAEAAIRDGRWQEGMTIINRLRTTANVPHWTANNQQEAMVALIKERAIVLWMESRRGGDFYRLNLRSENDPILQAHHRLSPAYAQMKLAGRQTCFPLSDDIVGAG